MQTAGDYVTHISLNVDPSSACGCAGGRQAEAWAEAARERGQGPDVAGRPDVEMVEAFSELERHLEGALAAARAPAAPPEVRAVGGLSDDAG